MHRNHQYGARTRTRPRVLAGVRAGLAVIAVCALVLLPACRRFTKAGADREVYGLLEGKRRGVPELAGTLDIEAKTRLADAIRERESFELDLRDTLQLATVASREYRQQRENVFLSALTLTQELNRFRPQWRAGASPRLNFTPDGVIVDGSTGITMSQALANGGSVVFGLASQFTRLFLGDPTRIAQSILDADVILPLMRGSGNLVAQEGLRQAERNTCYALRDYALFQQAFTVDIASRFYRALQQRDRWDNAEKRYRSFELLQEELSAKADEGTIPRFEADQSEQRLLESDDLRQRARNNFESAVDQLKLDIGIPVGVEVVLKDSDLAVLRSRGPDEVHLAEVEALQVARVARLDLRTSRDEEVDAVRQAEVAKDALRAGLDLVVGGNLGSTQQNPLDFNGRDLEGRLGFDIDLPLERTTERNIYRRALIDVDRARRNQERLEDTVTFEVRDSYRTLAQARRSYDIQVLSEQLATRRVESTQLLLELGKASTRDRLDAEDDLALARNAVTGALIDHFLARLALLRDIGKLRVDAEGSWRDPGGESPVQTQQAREAPLPQPPLVPTADGLEDQRRPETGTQGARAAPPGARRIVHAAPLPAVAAPAAGRPAPATATRVSAPESAGGLPPPRVVPRSPDTVRR